MPNWRELFLGRRRDVRDPHIFHKISLVAVLAWVGLGADGLSSSAYGPEAAFRALPGHEYLAFYLALATAFTVFIISYSYSRIIEAFPSGGGGYVVSTKMLGRGAGLISGSALLVDYVLTITTSVASGVDALWSLFPGHLQAFRLPAQMLVLLGLVFLNLRGVRESVTLLSPIFFTFLASHAILIGGAFLMGAPKIGGFEHHVVQATHSDLGLLGLMGLLALFFRAYSMGAGTYTGIEAVSNGLPMMREPRVFTGKKTMFYMALSLALTAAGILLCYFLLNIVPSDTKTMNASLTERFIHNLGHLPHGVGQGFLLVVLISEAMLLFVAAQSGFLDGPRVMSNMAVDSWFPHRFSALSEQLTMQNGVLLMGGAAMLALMYTRGNIETLLVMYSINVFVTFSLSQLAMIRYWVQKRLLREHWKRHVPIHIIGFLLCAGILCVTIYEKFLQGGWVTLAVTGFLVLICLYVHQHYQRLGRHVSQLDTLLAAVSDEHATVLRKPDPRNATAILMVRGFEGVGVHSLLWLLRLFPGHYKNVIFASVGVLDSASFKGAEETEALIEKTEKDLDRYVDLAQRLGLAAEHRSALGTDVVEEAEKLVRGIVKEYPGAIVFTSKVIFRKENVLQGLLHNETAYAVQRRLQFSGVPTMVLPVRISE